MKGGKNSKRADLDREKWKLYRREKKAEPADPEEAAAREERAERVREISASMGPPGLLKNKFGENVTVTRLG